MDRVDKAARSRMMARVKNKNTKPETLVRSRLHRLGFRFRNNIMVEGCRPDIVLKKHRTVIFVHGCFWHAHQSCRKGSLPKSNRKFWQEKFERNVARDVENADRLLEAGWNVGVIWECALKADKLHQIDFRFLLKAGGHWEAE